jgi:hypothetical protein
MTHFQIRMKFNCENDSSGFEMRVMFLENGTVSCRAWGDSDSAETLVTLVTLERVI